MCFYGVGNHSGGPTRENIESILRLNADPGFPELIFDTPDGFFERAFASGLPFPTVHDELQHHAVGCYSAHSGVKRLNRRTENALNFAEEFCAVARQVTGQEYQGDFDLAWKAVHFNPHLPALGYRTYRIVSGPSNEEDYPLQADERSVENDRFRLGLDPETSFISSLCDKQRQIEVLGGTAARPVVPETGEAYGLSILNEGKYGLDVRGEEVGLTVLRSPIYAHHDPFVPQPDESYSFVDQGIQCFTYALMPHSGG